MDDDVAGPEPYKSGGCGVWCVQSMALLSEASVSQSILNLISQQTQTVKG